MSNEYRDYQLRLAPPWLQEGEGGDWLSALGEHKDEVLAKLKDAVRAALPADAPSDGLSMLGSELRIERGSGESEESYRARLELGFDVHAWSGTRKGLLDYALAPMGFTVCGIVTTREWSSKFGGVPPDGDTSRWARYWLIIAGEHGIEDDGYWGDDSYWGEGGEPGIWGTSASPELIARVKRLVIDWSPAHSRCAGVFLVDTNAGVTNPTPTEVPTEAPWTFLQLYVGGEPVHFWQF